MSIIASWTPPRTSPERPVSFVGNPPTRDLVRLLALIPHDQQPAVRDRVAELYAAAVGTDHATLTDCWTRAITEAKRLGRTLAVAS